MSNASRRIDEAGDKARRRMSSVPQIIEKAKLEAQKLIGLKLNSVIGVTKKDDGWKVTVEMVEKESIPNSMDILGLYEIYLNKDGEIEGFERKALRKRIDTEISKPEI
jgi:hypothetical protein